jgi:hypothetical protein
MGKKPVVALGLVWAGMLVAGCGECCRKNTRPSTMHNPPPAFGGKAKEQEAPIVPPVGVPDKHFAPEPIKPADPLPITPPGGGQTKPLPNLSQGAAAPGSVETLRPTTGFASPPADPAPGRPTESMRPTSSLPIPPVPTESAPLRSGSSRLPETGGSPAPSTAPPVVGTSRPTQGLTPPPPLSPVGTAPGQ